MAERAEQIKNIINKISTPLQAVAFSAAIVGLATCEPPKVDAQTPPEPPKVSFEEPPAQKEDLGLESSSGAPIEDFLDEYQDKRWHLEDLMIKPEFEVVGTVEFPESAFFEDCLITDQSYIGVGSQYSRAGCVGCSPNLLTALGTPLDDNALTFASWKFPLGSLVMLTNLDNGESAKALLNDRGGFDVHGTTAKLRNRTFDITPGLARRLGGVATDSTRLEQTLLNCNYSR